MDQNPHEIEAHIDRTRQQLDGDFTELERKFAAALDWRRQFRERPYVFLGAAVAGGALLSAVLRPSAVYLGAGADRGGSHSRVHGSVPSQAVELWGDLTAALIGVASAKIKDYIGEVVPGFDEHYRAARERTSAPNR